MQEERRTAEEQRRAKRGWGRKEEKKSRGGLGCLVGHTGGGAFVSADEGKGGDWCPLSTGAAQGKGAAGSSQNIFWPLRDSQKKADHNSMDITCVSKEGSGIFYCSLFYSG